MQGKGKSAGVQCVANVQNGVQGKNKNVEIGGGSEQRENREIDACVCRVGEREQ